MIRALFILLFSALVGHASIELVGVFADADGFFFSLTDSDAKSNSRWLQSGDSFAGYTIGSYDKQAQILDVSDGPQTIHLRLRLSNIGDTLSSQARSPSTQREVAVQKALERMGTNFDEAKVAVRLLAHLRNGKIVYTCTEVWKKDESGPRVGDILVGVLPGQWMKDFKPYEMIVFFKEYPPREDTAQGSYPLLDGKLNLCPALPPDELRDILTSKRSTNR